MNLLRPELDVDASGTLREVAILQEPPSAPPGLDPVLRDHRMRVGLYDRVDGRLVLADSVELDVTGERTVVAALAGRPQPALLLLNDADLTYAKIRLDERSIATAVADLANLDDSLARTLIWGAAWDMTRDAELTAGQFVDLVVSGLPGESEIAVVQNVLAQASTAINLYSAPAHREGYRQRLATAVHGWIGQAQPGSDRQLALVRGLTLLASTDAHLDWLAGVLDGRVVVDGLAVDTDLRWSLVIRLAAKGRLAQDGIDAELERDATAAGRRLHAQAMAARPTEQAKQDAWQASVERDELPNAMLAATIVGVVQPEQPELMRAYRDRYFAALPTIWQTRTSDTAATMTQLLFPASLVEEETITAAADFLSSPQHPGAARLVAEGRDGVERALRAQRVDAAA